MIFLAGLAIDRDLAYRAVFRAGNDLKHEIVARVFIRADRQRLLGLLDGIILRIQHICDLIACLLLAQALVHAALQQTSLLGLRQRFRLRIDLGRLLGRRFEHISLLRTAGQKQGAEHRRSDRSFHSACLPFFFSLGIQTAPLPAAPLTSYRILCENATVT